MTLFAHFLAFFPLFAYVFKDAADLAKSVSDDSGDRIESRRPDDDHDPRDEWSFGNTVRDGHDVTRGDVDYPVDEMLPYYHE